jgi:hypothetical protein
VKVAHRNLDVESPPLKGSPSRNTVTGRATWEAFNVIVAERRCHGVRRRGTRGSAAAIPPRTHARELALHSPESCRKEKCVASSEGFLRPGGLCPLTILDSPPIARGPPRCARERGPVSKIPIPVLLIVFDPTPLATDSFTGMSFRKTTNLRSWGSLSKARCTGFIVPASSSIQWVIDRAGRRAAQRPSPSCRRWRGTSRLCITSPDATTSDSPGVADSDRNRHSGARLGDQQPWERCSCQVPRTVAGTC